MHFSLKDKTIDTIPFLYDENKRTEPTAFEVFLTSYDGKHYLAGRLGAILYLVKSKLTRHDYNDKLTDILRKNGVFSQKENYERDVKKSTTMFQDIHKSGGNLKTALNNAKKLIDMNYKENNPAQSNTVTMVYYAIIALTKDAGYEF